MNRTHEEARLERVIALVASQIKSLASELSVKRGSVIGARKEMWSETHAIRDFDDVALLASLLSDVSINEAQHAGASLRLNNLKRTLNSPYFGRIDFREDGCEETEEIYVGRQSVFDDDKKIFYVYDWRAPISSLYYDCTAGPASFAAPDGKVSGTITLKRQFNIENGKLIYFFDSDLIIDDEILQIELSKTSDAKIKTIIHTIQREQNAAIRSEAENIMVFGPAGSGKTSVGLHRLAYLLYRHRDNLVSAKVRIFSSNNIFSTYVAGVIPELGEEDVKTLDAKGLLGEYSSSGKLFSDSYEMTDYFSGSEGLDDARRAGIIIKYSPAFAEYAEDFIKNYSPAISEDVRFNKDVICPAARVAEMYADRTSAGSLQTKSARSLDYVNRCFDEYYKENKKPIAEFFNDLHDENFNDYEIKMKFEEQRSIVLSDLRGSLMPEPKRLYKKILQAYAREYNLSRDAVNFTHSALSRERLYFEDALVLTYIEALTGCARRDRSVRHILIDEAQDLCVMQHKLLRRVFEGCNFTVLADVNQALFPELNVTDGETLEKLYSDKNLSVVRLTKSYRSTFEINKFAAGLLEKNGDGSFFDRRGDEPEIVECVDAREAAAGLIKKIPRDYNTVGILFSGMKAAERFYNKFIEAKPDLNGRRVSLISDADDNFAHGISVMALTFAKGLEFDAVIVPEYGGGVFEGERGRRLLYLICTRALHNLYLLKEK